MTLEELAQHDGKDGRKAYVAVDKKIYDVTESSWWVGGHHEGRHQAGSDLTESLRSAPHFSSLIERFPIVDVLSEKPARQHHLQPLVVSLIVAVIVFLLILWMI